MMARTLSNPSARWGSSLARSWSSCRLVFWEVAVDHFLFFGGEGGGTSGPTDRCPGGAAHTAPVTLSCQGQPLGSFPCPLGTTKLDALALAGLGSWKGQRCLLSPPSGLLVDWTQWGARPALCFRAGQGPGAGAAWTSAWSPGPCSFPSVSHAGQFSLPQLPDPTRCGSAGLRQAGPALALRVRIWSGRGSQKRAGPGWRAAGGQGPAGSAHVCVSMPLWRVDPGLSWAFRRASLRGRLSQQSLKEEAVSHRHPAGPADGGPGL